MEKKKFFIWIALIAIAAVLLISIVQNKNAEDLQLANDFSRVEIEGDNAEIRIMPVEGSEAVIELENGNRYTLNAMVKRDTLEIEVERKWFKWFSIDFFSKSPTVIVGLPKEEYSKIKAETDNGKILIEDIESQQILAETDNGAIEASQIKVEELVAEADNGEIYIKDIESQHIAVESDNGDVVIENSTGIIKGKTANGELTVITDSLRESMDLEADNGEIFVKTKEKAKNVRFDVKTDHGIAKLYGQTVTEKAVGNGDIVIKLTSDNGDITVE
ncbi:MAG TPA: DUF4097 family beta strand repeat-containing protein [Ureibacillus sp.]|nr:DUF4097 family beta strand repeat-containing protein [Ureibacillus sp.]